MPPTPTGSTPTGDPDLPPIESLIDPAPDPRQLVRLIHEPITNAELAALREGRLRESVRRPVGQGCHCVRSHTPGSYVAAWHHIKPQSWGGLSVPENLALVCPNTHTATHRLLDEYVRANGDPGYPVRRMFGEYVRAMVNTAWAQRPEHPTITSLVRPVLPPA